MIGNNHDIMIAHGFKRLSYELSLPMHIKEFCLKSFRYSYIGTRKLTGYPDTSLVIAFNSIPFDRWPTCFLMSPNELAKINIAHVELPKGTFCYIDEAMHNITPHSFELAIAEVFQCIDEQLIRLYSRTSLNDINTEIIYYLPKDYVALIYPEDRNQYIARVYKDKENKAYKFIIEPINSTLHKPLTDNYGDSHFFAPVIYLDLEDRFRHNNRFPLEDFNDFFHWLQSISSNLTADFASQLRACLHSNNKTNKQFFIVLGYKVENDGIKQYQSFKIKFERELLTSLRRPKAKLIKHKLLSLKKDKIFTNKVLGVDLFEFGPLINISPTDGVIRNCGLRNFINKNIVIIGAGTLGGYVFQQILSMGGGISTLGRHCQLTIIDKETFSADNMSRHVLGFESVGKSKAHALKQLGMQQIPIGKITPIAEELNTRNISQHIPLNTDLIIDVTGNVHFSNLLARFHHHKLPSTPLLHGWIEYGCVGEMLGIMKGRGCYQCLTLLNGEKRFPRNKKGNLEYITKRDCGSSYAPFPVTVSTETASHVVNAALSLLFDDIQSTVFFPMQHPGLKYRQTKKFTSLKGCGNCCNDS